MGSLGTCGTLKLRTPGVVGAIGLRRVLQTDISHGSCNSSKVHVAREDVRS